jgi:hypothetical protein
MRGLSLHSHAIPVCYIQGIDGSRDCLCRLDVPCNGWHLGSKPSLLHPWNVRHHMG